VMVSDSNLCQNIPNPVVKLLVKHVKPLLDSAGAARTGARTLLLTQKPDALDGLLLVGRVAVE
jgi:hypothetical protein